LSILLIAAHLYESTSFPVRQEERGQAFAKAGEEDLPDTISSLTDKIPYMFSISQKGLIAH